MRAAPFRFFPRRPSWGCQLDPPKNSSADPAYLEKISRLFRFASDYQRGIPNLTGVADGASASAWLSARISWSWLDKSQPRSHTWGVE
jgi:hypothetical protein